MPKRNRGNSGENMAEEDGRAFAGVQSARLSGLALIEKLPIELWERIFEFVGEIDYVSDCLPVDFLDDETSGPYPFIPRERHLEVPIRTEPAPYDYLCSSSLESRAFTAPAQRALFRVSKTRSSIPLGMLRLLRSLLEYPANRKCVQWLVTSPLPRENMIGRDNPPDILDPVTRAAQVLGPLLTTPVLDQLRNASFFRLLLLPYAQDGLKTANPPAEIWTLRPFFPVIGDQILRAILELCPQIQGARLFYYNTWMHWEETPPLSGTFLSLPDDGLLGRNCSRLKSLTLDTGALY